MQNWYYRNNAAQKIFMFILSLLLVPIFGVGLIPLFILVYLELGSRFTKSIKNDKYSNLVFASTSTLEQALDGSDALYNAYFYAIYHCLPNEKNGVTEYRNQLREKFPDKVVMLGKHFVLLGEAAYLSISSYYFALSEQAESEEFRIYAKSRYEAVSQKYKNCQSLPFPIDLTEGQFCNDEKLDFYTSMAISNGQVCPKGMRLVIKK